MRLLQMHSPLSGEPEETVILETSTQLKHSSGRICASRDIRKLRVEVERSESFSRFPEARRNQYENTAKALLGM